jgi:hypothetical protein
MNWISVEDELPKGISNALAFGNDTIYFVFYNSCGSWCLENEYLYNITHWMPLPEPPKDNK